MTRSRIATVVALAAFVTVVRIPADAVHPVYKVGAASIRIDPDAAGSPLPHGTAVNKGGLGFGDGSTVVSRVFPPGGKAKDEGDHVQARAIVIDDGKTVVAMAIVETQGMFAAYQRGIPGLIDIARAASAEIKKAGGNLPAQNIDISNDHTHSGPDMIGAWGFVPDVYARFIGSQTVKAIVQAYGARRPATLVAGADDAPDLIYNMTCTEALDQSPSDTYPTNICTPTQEHKDSWLRVLQARAPNGRVIATMMAYAAHATEGLGRGLNGDWPQFMSELLGQRYGGLGLAFEGTVGRTQPCRPRCSFTNKKTPGYALFGRREAYPAMLLSHVQRALANATPLHGPVNVQKTFIRHDVENAGLFAAFYEGSAIGAPIARSRNSPWTVGNTILTPVSTIRIGSILIEGLPGEAYVNIPQAVADAIGFPLQRVWTLGLTDDQLGYLIAPSEAYPLIAAQAAVNDNSLFALSPTLGDHITCAAIRLAGGAGFRSVQQNPRCPAWDAFDAVGDPLSGLP